MNFLKFKLLVLRFGSMMYIIIIDFKLNFFQTLQINKISIILFKLNIINV